MEINTIAKRKKKMITINEELSTNITHGLKYVYLKTGKGDIFLGELSEHKSEWIFMDYIVEPYTTFTIQNEADLLSVVRRYYNEHLLDVMELAIDKLKKDV